MPSRSPRFISGRDDFDRLNESERTERTDALRVVRAARDDGTTVEHAARQLGVRMGTVTRWVPEALDSDGAATWPTPTDDLFRLRPIALDDDVGFIGVYGPEQADEANEIFSVQWDFIRGYAGVDSLDQLPEQFAGRPVVRDPDGLISLGRRGAFAVDELYRELFS